MLRPVSRAYARRTLSAPDRLRCVAQPEKVNVSFCTGSVSTKRILSSFGVGSVSRLYSRGIMKLTVQTPSLPDWATGLVMAIVMALFMVSGPIERALGKTGITVVTRLLGMLLAALSVQFVLDGLAAFGFGPGTG